MAWPAAIAAAAAAIGGGLLGQKNEREINKRNYEQQKEMAQHGLRWKVEDAKRAGIAPEYALGASTYQGGGTYTTSNPMGNAVANAGQEISRAVLASGTKEDRDLDRQMKAETLRGMRMDNDIRQTQMRPQVTLAQNPPFPHPNGNVIEGQGNSPVKDVQLERTGQSRNAPHSEGASIPSVGWATTSDGGLRPVPSQDIKNRIEDQIIPETIWGVQHQLGPNFGFGEEPPKEALPKGYKYWHWSVYKQAFYPSKKDYKLKTRIKEADYYKKYKTYKKHGLAP